MSLRSLETGGYLPGAGMSTRASPGNYGSMTRDPDLLQLRVTNAPVGTNSLLLRMSPELVDEVRARLDEAGLNHGEVLEFSAGAELAIEMVQILAGAGAALGGLAAVIRAITRRNDGKKVELSGDRIDSITGYSPDDAEELLEIQWKKQQENEDAWKKEIEKGKGREDT